MNPKLTFKPSEFACAKCGDIVRTDRHHIKSQKMWVTQFAVRRAGQKKYNTFVKRYKAFRPADIALLCRDCHEWIHEEYLYLLLDHYNPMPFSEWTWGEAYELMRKFEKFFKKWVEE